MPRTAPLLPDPHLASPLDVAVADRRGRTLAMVREALDAGKARLAFQPVVTARAAPRVAFFEGLIRLQDPEGRTIPAGYFIAAVEEDALGREIDCRALSLGLRALKADPGLRLSVNMSARSIGWPRWREILDRHVAKHPDAVERLILEITESSAIGLPEVVRGFMADTQAAGVTFALDDFGAGYTAFRHLRDFTFDILKIDGQFARAVHQDADNQVLMEALISVARHFDMLSVAEAVETPAEAAWLSRAGVDCLQGYHFGVPAAAPVWPEPRTGYPAAPRPEASPALI